MLRDSRSLFTEIVESFQTQSLDSGRLRCHDPTNKEPGLATGTISKRLVFCSILRCYTFFFIMQTLHCSHHSDCYLDNRGFSWHAKNREKRKSSEDVCQNPVEHDAM